jgi:mycothiol synthase
MKPTDISQPATFRTAAGEADFWQVRRFLLDAWALAPLGAIWDVRRWDGAYFHRAQPGWDEHWRGGAAVGIWEAGHRIVAVAHPESAGEAWLEVHPAYRCLEDAMLAWAEDNLAAAGKDGRRKLTVCVGADDLPRQELMHRRGYSQTMRGEVLRRFCGPPPPQPAAWPAGYTLHTMRPGHPGDCERYAALLNDAFRRTIHSAQEVATFTTLSPSFDARLELIAAAPDGSYCALAGMIYDADNRYGLFEPVCATRKPRPLGLTGGLLHEGVRRVLALGARECYVGTSFGMPANRFYSAAGFKVVYRAPYWEKEL